MAAAKPISIKDRIKQMAAQAAPSMVPEPVQPVEIPAPPPKEEETIPSISSFIEDAKQRLQLARLVSRHGELGESIKPLKKERDKLTDSIKVIVGTYKIGKAVSGEWNINYFSQNRETIKRDKLMLALARRGIHGQDALDILSECLVSKPAYTLKIGRGNSDDDEE